MNCVRQSSTRMVPLRVIGKFQKMFHGYDKIRLGIHHHPMLNVTLEPHCSSPTNTLNDVILKRTALGSISVRAELKLDSGWVHSRSTSTLVIPFTPTQAHLYPLLTLSPCSRPYILHISGVFCLAQCLPQLTTSLLVSTSRPQVPKA